MNGLPLGNIYIHFLFYSAQRWMISCTPCSENCSSSFCHRIIPHRTSVLQAGLDLRTNSSIQIADWQTTAVPLPCAVTSGIRFIVRLSRVESVTKNGIMFVGKPRTGDPVTVLTTHVNRENCPLYGRTCQR